MKLNNPFFFKLLAPIVILSAILDISSKILDFQRKAEIERITYESVNVITPFKLTTFSTEWRNNILLQPEEKI